MKPRVLVTETIHPAGWAILKRETDPVAWAGLGRQLLTDAVRDARGILVWMATLSPEVIKAAPLLKIIAKHGVQCSNINIPAATAAGIVVTNTPQAHATSVAEHALALMLALARRIGNVTHDLALRQIRPHRYYEGVQLSGKVLGIIGVGNTGARLAQMAGGGFGMRVLGFDPYLTSWPPGVERCRDLVPLLQQADFLSLHVPVTPDTRHLIGRETLSRLKPGCILVNTAWPGLIDEAVVTDAVKFGRLAGVGLDVVEGEPLRPTHPLRGLPNVILTPHVAPLTDEGMMAMAQEAAEEIVRVLHGERPKYPVNPEVLGRTESDRGEKSRGTGGEAGRRPMVPTSGRGDR